MEGIGHVATLVMWLFAVFILGSVVIVIGFIQLVRPDRTLERRTTPRRTLTTAFLVMPTPTAAHPTALHCPQCQTHVAWLDEARQSEPPPLDPTLTHPWCVQAMRGFWVQPTATATRWLSIPEPRVIAYLWRHHVCPTPSDPPSGATEHHDTSSTHAAAPGNIREV